MDLIDAEIEKSEAVVVRIIKCKQQIEEGTRIPTSDTPSVVSAPALPVSQGYKN